jgi:hypothetical protein
VAIRKLVLDPAHPTRHDLDVLEGIAATGLADDADRLYLRQAEAFDVERLTDRFYRAYAGLFQRTVARVQEANRGHRELATDAGARAFTQRLLHRLLFLHFLQRKGWLADDPHFLATWYRRVTRADPPGNAWRDFLRPLFFETLNRRRISDGSPWGKIPYLNGRLFEPVGADTDERVFLPDELFDPRDPEALLGFLGGYNFTVAEDTPLEQEVALDPELLGKVFENLLEETERGQTGTFYTPRPVVHYLARRALRLYLEEQTGLSTDRLDLAFADDSPLPGGEGPGVRAEGDGLTVPEADRIERALERVRVLDPAVGSGAFLVGMLHELVGLRRACYRARGVEVPRGSSLVAKWKRDFIGHSLYGVDIKAEAVEIARLRLWLSLVVDLDRDQAEPLPNLDYKLMVGDSLLETVDGEPILPKFVPGGVGFPVEPVQGTLPGVPAAPVQLGLGMGAADRARADLETLKERYFAAEEKGERDRLRVQIEGQERAVVLAALEEKLGDLDAQVQQLVAKGSQVNWQGMRREKRELERLAARKARLADLAEKARIGEPLPFFLYRLHFFEVFRDRGGFDVVLANPPYVRQELIKEQKPELKAAYPEVYHGVADLYVYFYARGLGLLREGGVLAYVSSDKFFRARYASKLRTFLRDETTLEEITDFGELPLFSATVEPAVVLACRAKPTPGHQIQVMAVDEMGILEKLEDEVSRQAWGLPQHTLRADGWTLERPEVLQLLKKLRVSGQSLGDYVQGQFFNGVKTGLNEAFVIDEVRKDKLISEDPRSTELIRPWVQGRDIDRWVVHWSRQYLLYVVWDCPIERYPAIQAHLAQFREALERRDGVRDNGPCPWYALSRPRLENESAFEQPKIIYPQIARTYRFAFDEEARFGNDKTFFMPVTDLYLLAILQSPVVELYLHLLTATKPGGFMNLHKQYVEKVPIPDAPPSERQAIERLVRRLLALRGEGAEAEALERELNERVYRLFGLTKAEIALIEESLGRSAGG